MKNFWIVSLFSILFFQCSGQRDVIEITENPGAVPGQPKLVVGIVIDQMRYDYLYKYWEDYTDDGFKRLLKDGFSCENHHFSYAPTFTGPGHASVYTGTTPANHGIIGNNWYDKASNTVVYCAKDTTHQSVGTTSASGQMSAKWLISSTLGDEMKLFSNRRSKVVAISMKDRGAVLPAGHLGDAYWYEGSSYGTWITSTRYMSELPEWVKEYNARNRADHYLNQDWELLHDIDVYDESAADNSPYESPFKGSLNTKMPYNLKELASSNYDYSLLKATPWGNCMTTEMAVAAIAGESLGQDEHTDLLAVSYSSTDYVGHSFGPQSLEMQDTYLRMDLEIKALLDALDAAVGTGNYTLFLTADHGAVEIPGLMNEWGLPANTIRPGAVEDSVNNALMNRFDSDTLVKKYYEQQFYLNMPELERLNLDRTEVVDAIINTCLGMDGIQTAFDSKTVFTNGEFQEGVMSTLQKGHHTVRSGDVLIVPEPGWLITSYLQGTTHGSPFAYDTHVPLIFYGSNIPAGSTVQRTLVEDIAATLSAMMHIQMPNACSGNPIGPLFK